MSRGIVLGGDAAWTHLTGSSDWEQTWVGYYAVYETDNMAEFGLHHKPQFVITCKTLV